MSNLTNMLDGMNMSALVGVFGAMDTAECEIERAIAEHPDKREKLNAAFWLMRPTEAVMPRQALHRSHMRELLKRVARGDRGATLALPTHAEVCGAFSEMSITATLNSQAAAIMARAFNACFPDKPQPCEWHDWMDDEYARTLGRLRQDWRAGARPT